MPANLQKAHPQTLQSLEATKTLREDFTPASSVDPGSWVLEVVLGGVVGRPAAVSRKFLCPKTDSNPRVQISRGQHPLCGEDFV